MSHETASECSEDPLVAGGTIRVGISGWTYSPWRGIFYPKGLKREQELAYAASHLRAIEINGTFYGMQRPDAFGSWADQVPADFVFSVKGPRYITHMLRLRDPLVPLANFVASGLLRLGIHLGPILWQFPANFRFSPARIEPFLKMLPRDTAAAAALGRRHDNKLRAPAWLEVESRRPIRHAFEIRHDSFRCQQFIDLLRSHDVGLVCSDSVEWPRLMDVTSDFIYCRLHGAKELYASNYDNAALDEWGRRIKAWAGGGEPDDAERVGGRARSRKRDVFVFFDNDRKVRAPANAMELIRRLHS
ncbi:MAG: hypothetical protein QOF90_1858 [Acetobacteraceae bacterium]|jgi:uncharacterized protein YecE (DUF72 family)|nr:hypothetical protein [Acetobacteraceae bacterium]MEA2788301.1 hypothetical protein [Acetobacteraceae bacterium]